MSKEPTGGSAPRDPKSFESCAEIDHSSELMYLDVPGGMSMGCEWDVQDARLGETMHDNP